jgi:hypothetical protein
MIFCVARFTQFGSTYFSSSDATKNERQSEVPEILFRNRIGAITLNIGLDIQDKLLETVIFRFLR